MTNYVKKEFLKLFAFILTVLTIFTVNSTCFTLLGQPNEPDSLKRFKKIVN